MKSYPLFKGKFGLEKENIRVDRCGNYSLTQHNNHFIDNNPYITRDFSESQIEMITQPKDSIKEALGELHNIQYVVLESLKDEYLWPQSNPPILPDDEHIQVAKIKNNDQIKYREYLSGRYGKKTTAISGIHFNFSFSDETFENLKSNKSVSTQDFKNELYLKVATYFIKYQWLFTYLFAASPVFHKTYKSTCVSNSNVTIDGDCSNRNLISLRNSECGYKNDGPLLFNYQSVSHLQKSTEELISTGRIISKSEIYENIRIKIDSDNNIDYLELRFIDINPYEFVGVNELDLQFLHLIAIYFATLDDFTFSTKDQLAAYQKNIIINNFVDESNPLREKLKLEGFELLNNLKKFMETVETPYHLKGKLNSYMDIIAKESKSLASTISRDVKNHGYINFHLNIAKEHHKLVSDYPLNLKNYDGLELSTKILLQSSIKNGIISKIIDKADNFIQLQDDTGRTELVKQATKTSLDNYVSILAMENKQVTKMLLEAAKISTPTGITLNTHDIVNYKILKTMLPSRVVVKPNSTNFGIGITILQNDFSKHSLKKAVDFAFEHDENIIIENFIPGLEYRFLVIDHEVVAVLHRKAAHVVGDGEHTVEELIQIKNTNPLRGTGYETPLEKIIIDEKLIEYIVKQDFSLETILDINNILFLRETSNISTGGDSIDVTDIVNDSYKSVAIQAAKALGVSITGVDMIIENIELLATPENHSIIELNFNPAIHIHNYPYIGVRRDIGSILIKALFKTGTKVT